jgi:lysozyme family protein
MKMNGNFEKSLEKLLIHEGGFVNHPSDPGGMTNLGVTKQVWEEWVSHPVSEKEMRNLTPLMVSALYKRKYWDSCFADELISGLDYCVFDCAVNSGVGRAVKLLQSCVGATPDGGFGSITNALVKKASLEPNKIIELYSAKRLEFLESLRTFPTFGKGWSRRVAEVKATALEMVNNEVQHTV